MAGFTVQDVLARSALNIEIEVLSKAVAFPESDSLGMALIVAIGHEGIPNAQSRGEMTNQGWEEIAASGAGSANHDVTKSLFCNMALGNVVNQSNDSHDFPVCVQVRRECAGLPDIPAIASMPRDKEVVRLDDFPIESSAQDLFHTGRAQPGEYFHCNTSNHFFGRLAGQPLHEGIEDHVTKFGIVSDDSLRRAFNDLVVELVGFAKGDFYSLVF